MIESRVAEGNQDNQSPPPEKQSLVDIKSDNQAQKNFQKMELQLNSPWTFYYFQKDPEVEYENSIHKIAKFSTAEGFWQIYSHMIRPEKLPQKVSIQLFRNDSRAMWEDEENRKGGDFLIRLPKRQVNFAWERLALNLIGEQLPEDVNGIVVSTRERIDLVYVWHKTAGNKELRLEIANSLAKVLELPFRNKIDYYSFDPEGCGIDPNTNIQYVVEQNGVEERLLPKTQKAPEQKK